MSRAASVRAPGFLVTGTDTGVGKTVVACVLLRAFAAKRLRVCGMKPVAAGARRRHGVLVNEDVEHLVAASNVKAPREWVNPYLFVPPIAPHIAAREAGVTISLARIERSLRALSRRADLVVVEGAGGFAVPLNGHAGFPALARRLNLPVILVVGMRLGCISHALLTAAAIRSCGLPLVGWVANHIDARMARPSENVRAIGDRIGAPLLARVPYQRRPASQIADTRIDVDMLPRDG